MKSRGNKTAWRWFMNRYGALIALFIVACVIPISGCVGGGCVKKPPKLSGDELTRINQLGLPLSVGVERYRYPVYSENLAKDLRRLHVFTIVGPLEKMITQPDLIARVEEPVYGPAIVFLITLITFGIIPTRTPSHVGHVYSLQAAPRRSKLIIDSSLKEEAMLGLIAWPMLLSPEWTLFEKNDRYYQWQKLAIARKQENIRDLCHK